VPLERGGAEIRNRPVLHLTLALVWLFAAPSAHAQDAQTKFRLGQAYEQAGDFEHAIQMYRQLLAAEPGNVVYFDATQRVLLQLKRYDDAAALITSRLEASPSDPALRATLGSVYYRAGREPEALQEWDRVIAADPRNPQRYRIIAGVMLENRLLERAAQTYRDGRIACTNPSLFIMELAQLLAASMDYRGATTEYVGWLAANPQQMSFVQSRMGAYTWKPDGRTAAVDAVREALNERDDVRLHELLAWLYVEGKEFDAALDEHRTIDRMGKTRGVSLAAFADRAFKEGAFDIAARAYRDAIAAPLTGPKLPAAHYGYASALREIDAQSDTLQGPLTPDMKPASESRLMYGGAITYFRTVAKDFPATVYAAQSHYQIGRIQAEKHFDLDAALESYAEAARARVAPPALRFDIALREGEIHLSRGDSARAAASFASVAGAPGATPDQIDEASFRHAETDYFHCNFDGAADRLSGITANLRADFANDALRLQAFLEEHRTAGDALLCQCARGDYFRRQRKLGDAAAVYRDLFARKPGPALADDILLRIGEVEAASGRFEDAIASYGKVLEDFKETSTHLDRAHFSIAEVYQFGLNDRAKAIAAYEQLLADYPRSILVSLARARIRALRGDAL
jgi:tetratricopeptide (TPR) repeat protein